jgi:hypothetical protein
MTASSPLPNLRHAQETRRLRIPCIDDIGERILKHVKPDWASARTAEDVGKELQREFPDLEIRGFDDRYKPDIHAVREFAEAIHDMLTKYSKYPQVVVTTVSITKPPTPGLKGAWAWATPRPTGDGYMSTAIDLNADMATDWGACREQMQDELDAGWAHGDPDRPVYSAIIHEFGHAIDHAANEAAHEQTKQVLEEVWKRTAPPGVDYRTWVREQLTTQRRV